MLTLAAWLTSENVTNAEFARRLGKRLKRSVSDQNVYRWTLPPSHAEYSVPSPENVVAIYFETNKEVRVESWYQHLVNPVRSKRRKAAA